MTNLNLSRFLLQSHLNNKQNRIISENVFLKISLLNQRNLLRVYVFEYIPWLKQNKSVR